MKRIKSEPFDTVDFSDLSSTSNCLDNAENSLNTRCESEKLRATCDTHTKLPGSEHLGTQNPPGVLISEAQRPSPSLSTDFNGSRLKQPCRKTAKSILSDRDGFVSFGGFERNIRQSNSSIDICRAKYADAVVPKHNLYIPGRCTLRLYEIVPKNQPLPTSLESNSPPNSADQCEQLPSTIDHDVTPADQPYMTFWNCSHQTMQSRRGSDSIQDADLGVAEGSSPVGSRTQDIPSSSVESSIPGVVLTVNCLRPSAQLLVRIGRELVQSQYKHLTVDECACGKVRHMEETDLLPEELDKQLLVPADLSDDSLVAEGESTHLTWRRKPDHPRWARVRALCKIHCCPFIPSTIFQLHRHLEQGHQKLMRFALHGKRKKSLTHCGTSESAGDIVMPMTFNPNSRVPQCIACPICPNFKRGLTAVTNHIVQTHPFISPKLLANQSRHYCGICGTVVSPSTGRLGAYGTYVHSDCVPDTMNVRYAAWANCNTHPLACFILNPNRYSRISLTESMVRKLYHSMDCVLSMNLGCLRLSPVYSCILRSRLAVSSLFGELINMPPMKFNLSHANLAPVNIPVGNSVEKTKVNQQCILSRTLIGSTPSILREQRTESDVSTPITVLQTVRRKRTSITPVAKSLCSEPPSKHPRLALKDQATPVVPFSELDSQNTIMVDLTGNHGDTGDTGCALEQVTTNKHSAPSNVSQCKPANTTLVRTARIMRETCEICGRFVLSCRQHLNESHARDLGLVPSEFCIYCGRLFWTEEGCDNHQNLKCAFCHKEVCQSTLYLHLAEEHSDQFVQSLDTSPIICPVCHAKFPELAMFLTHGRLIHQCLVPRDVCSQLLMDNIQPILRGPPLSDLRILQTQCKHSLRKRATTHACIPSNIVTYDVSGHNLPVYTCSVCSSSFISLAHLDFHILMAGHQYWCAFCPYACRKGAELSTHHKEFHQNTTNVRLVPSATFRNGIQSVTKLGPSLSNSSTSNLPVVVRSTQPNQIHGCNMCPVFCLTPEDLTLHQLTVHKRVNDSLHSKLGATVHQATSTMDGTTIVVASCTNPINSTVHHCRSLNSFAGHRPRITLPNTNNALMKVRSPLIVRPSNSLLSSALITPINSPLVSSIPVSSSSSLMLESNDELVCPVCDFRSNSRSEVMQHIVDTH